MRVWTMKATQMIIQMMMMMTTLLYDCPQTNGMEQLRIVEEMQRHRTSHNTLDKHYANDDSRVHMYELAKPLEPGGSNRLSAPECGLKKSPLSNSLTDLCAGMHGA